MMKKCLLWGMGYCFRQYVYMVKFHEMLNHFKVVGVTSNTSIYSGIEGYKYIPKNSLHNIDFDFVIIMAKGNAQKQILNEALELGMAKEHIFTYTILPYLNSDVDRYIDLKKSPPSIFANNCWGGYTYRSLGLEFTSPLINMYESETDYLKLLKEPKRYMNEELELIETRYNETEKIHFPIVRCGDITLYFCHYDSFENAKECWERRKQRIDWNHLFVMMYTENRDVAGEFAKLPYEKKICFVPFRSDEQSLIHVEFRNKNEMAEISFGKVVLEMAVGIYPYYDVFDLIEKAKLTKIVEFA